MGTMVSGEADETESTPGGDGVLERIAAFLTARTTMTLAYADEDGPQACAVFFTLSRLPGRGPVPLPHFVSSVRTRHGRACEPGARVAFTVQEDAQVWTSLTGVQGRGRVRKLEGAEQDAAFRDYLTAFPFVAASDTLREALARTEGWEVVPDWLRLIDNRHGLGHKEEWTRPDPA